MPDRPKKRRWLRRFLIAAILAASGATALLVFALAHLDWIAKWAIHRAFPGVIANLESIRIESSSRLLVRKLELKSAADGETLLAMESGTARFRFSEIWKARIESLDLDQPRLVISPALGNALGIKPHPTGSARKGGSAPGFAIGELNLNNGVLRLADFGKRTPSVEMRVSASLKDFGVGAELGKIVHEITISEIVARSSEGAPFLSVDRVGVRFTTDGVFAKDHVDTIAIGNGSAEIGQELLDFFGGEPGNSSGEDSAPVRWTVGNLSLGDLAVAIPNAPGALGRVDFHTSADLHDVGSANTAGGSSPQSITLSNLRIKLESQPSAPLLVADSAQAAFTIAGLAEHRASALTLENPVIDLDVSKLPAAGDVGAKPSTPSAKSPEPIPWLVDHVTCRYGTLHLSGLHDGEVSATANFAIDAKDFGTLGDAGDTRQSLTIWGVQLDRAGAETPLLSLDLVRIGFTPRGLLDGQRIEEVSVQGGRLRIGSDLQSLIGNSQSSDGGNAGASPTQNGWTIGKLAISGVRARLEDERPDITELHFTINTNLTDVSTSGLSEQLLDKVQLIELADITLRSPLDRSIKILTLRSIFVRFTLRDIAAKHLREVIILRPTIYLNQDLFVYMERATAAEDSPAPAASPANPEPQWSVDRLEVKFGKLVLGSGATSDVGLPLEFETVLEHVALDNLASLQMQGALRVPRQSYDFKDYQLAVNDVQGDLRFSYPPEKGEKNLVQKLEISGIRWRQFLAKDAWIAATFDVTGINGQFGGAAYDGYVNGGFSFFFSQDSPWIGWVAGTGIDTASFTDVISPQNFKMTGPLDFSVQVDAFRKDIDRLRGDFHVAEPGTLKIGKLDDMIARIPDAWTSLKQDTARIALETLRDFDYTKATGDFWFVQSQGILNLDLSGPNGSRNFEIVLHDGQETDNPWQKGRLGKQ